MINAYLIPVALPFGGVPHLPSVAVTNKPPHIRTIQWYTAGYE